MKGRQPADPVKSIGGGDEISAVSRGLEQPLQELQKLSDHNPKGVEK